MAAGPSPRAREVLEARFGRFSGAVVSLDPERASRRCGGYRVLGWKRPEQVVGEVDRDLAGAVLAGLRIAENQRRDRSGAGQIEHQGLVLAGRKTHDHVGGEQPPR